MKESDIHKAERIVKAIECDFTARSGLRQEWEQIDAETQTEIRETWARLICEELAKEECNDCIAARAPEPPEQAFGQPENLDDWHLFTIRSDNATALSRHRRDMESLGFRVGPVEKSRGWAESRLPPGWFYFSARIRKAALSAEDFDSLCEWDRLYGEFPKEADDDMYAE